MSTRSRLKIVANKDIKKTTSGFLFLIPNKISLFSSVHIRSQLPLDIGVVLLQGTLFDLKQSHFKPRSNLRQFYLVVRSSIDVVSERHIVLAIDKRHYPFTVRFGDRKQVFQDALQTFTEFSGEIVEDEMRVDFLNWTHVRDIMSHDDV